MIELIPAVLSSLRYAAPVGFAAIGESIGQRSGVLNIGLEGIMLTAAYTATIVSESTGSAWMGLGAGVLAALALGAIQALFSLSLRADQVVVGTAINLLALGLTATLYRARYGQVGKLLSVPRLPEAPFLALLLALALVAAWALVRTKWGLATRAAGAYPEAVASTGLRPMRLRWIGAMLSAFGGGIGGAFLALGIAGSFAPNMTAGRGFLAIAMVTFGRWKPQWALLAALLVGATETLQYGLQAAQSPIPSEILKAAPYLVALAVLVLSSRNSAAPAKLGEPYA